MATDSPPPAPAPVVERPGTVTAAGITLIVLGSLTLLLGLILLIVGGLFAGAAGVPESEVPAGFGGMMGAFAGAIIVFMLIVIAFGVLQLVSGIKVLAGRNWARITGIVVAAIAGLFSLAGLGGNDGGGVIFTLIVVAANAFVIWALVTAGPWFAARTAR